MIMTSLGSLADDLAPLEELDDDPLLPPVFELWLLGFVFLVLVLSSSESMISNTSLFPIEELLFLFRFFDLVEELRSGTSSSKSRTTISFPSPEGTNIRVHKSTLN